jgi:predicted MFS family arabinose efflux permease
MESSTKSSENPYPLIWVGWWITVITVSDFSLVSPLLPNFLEQFHIGADKAGLIMGCYNLGAASVVLMAGILADRVGCRNVLVAAIGMVALGELFSAISTAFTPFLAARTLVGAGSAAASLALTTYVGLHIPYNLRGKVMGLIGSAYFLGTTLGPFLVTQIADRLSLRTLFLAYSFLALIGTLHALYALQNDPPHDRVAGSWRDYRTVLGNRGFWGIVIVQSLFSFGVVGMIVFFGNWLESVHGLDTQQRGLVFLIGGVPIIAGSPLGGVGVRQGWQETLFRRGHPSAWNCDLCTSLHRRRSPLGGSVFRDCGVLGRRKVFHLSCSDHAAHRRGTPGSSFGCPELFQLHRHRPRGGGDGVDLSVLRERRIHPNGLADHRHATGLHPLPDQDGAGRTASGCRDLSNPTGMCGLAREVWG